MNHSSGLESVRPFSATSNAALSVRERRLGLANRLLDRYHASLHSEVVLLSWSLLWVAVNSNPGSSAFPSKGEGDRIGSAMPSSTWNANPSPTVSARAWIYIVCSTASQSRIGFWRLSLVVLIPLSCILDVFSGTAAPRPGRENLFPHGSMQQNARGAYAVAGHCGSYLAWCSYTSPPTDSPSSSAAPSGQQQPSAGYSIAHRCPSGKSRSRLRDGRGV